MGLLGLLVYAAFASLFGVALGERGELGIVQHVFTTVVPLATLVLTIVARRGRVHTLVTGLAMLGGLLLGQQQFDRAWAGCAGEAESVRQALLRHHARLGGYPDRLEELEIDLPCRCGFRATIIHYLSNDRGFRLWISDDATMLVATDRTPFTATGRSSDRPPR